MEPSVVRTQFNGVRPPDDVRYNPRFIIGDLVILKNIGHPVPEKRNGILNKMYRVRTIYSSTVDGGMWTAKTMLTIEHPDTGERAGGWTPWNSRFDLATGEYEENCYICKSSCKADEICPFFISMLDGEE